MVYVSQRIADCIRRYRLSYFLSTYFNGVSRHKYVYCCIMVSIMFFAANRAYPSPISKSQRIIFESTTVTEFGTWEKTINDNQFFSVPISFVIQHLSERIETNLGNSSTQFPVSNHITNCQILNGNNIIIFNQAGSQLIQVIFPRVSNEFMDTSNFNTLPVPSITSILSARKNTLFFFQLLHFNRQESRIFNCVTIGKNSQTLNAKINTNTVPGFWQGLYVFIKNERYKVFPRRLLGYRNRCGITCKLSTPFNFKLAKTRDFELFIYRIPFESTFCIFSRLFASFLFESRVTTLFPEIISKSGLQMSESLLSGYTGNFIQPDSFRVIFPSSKQSTCFTIVDRFLFFLPSFRSDRQSSVINISATPKHFFKMFNLYVSWIESIRISNFHEDSVLKIEIDVKSNLKGKKAIPLTTKVVGFSINKHEIGRIYG